VGREAKSERPFDEVDLDAFTGIAVPQRQRAEALYLRISGSAGQASSLAAHEAELRRTASGPVVAVFRDRASSFRERRRGLDRLLTAASEGSSRWCG